MNTTAQRRRHASVALTLGGFAFSVGLVTLVGFLGPRWAPPWPLFVTGGLGGPLFAVCAGAYVVATARGEPAHRLVGCGLVVAGALVLAGWATFAGLVLVWVTGGVPTPD
ncbi:MAG: hypothetical protein H6735_00115 [Alphaproteobacteria bacterium]|nr:hypothetical protein [Alphaproteobacteria bacterium]